MIPNWLGALVMLFGGGMLITGFILGRADAEERAARDKPSNPNPQGTGGAK